MSKNKKEKKMPNKITDNLEQFIRNGVFPVVLKPGFTYSGFNISDIKQDTAIIGNGATIIGELHFINCGIVTISGCNIKGPADYGIKIDKCAGADIHDNTLSGIKITAIETANTPNVAIYNNDINGVSQQHGIYCSQSGDNIRISGNNIKNVERAGVQVNAVQDSTKSSDPNNDSISNNVVISGNHIDGCQKAGAAAIQCSGVHTGHINDNTIVNNFGRNHVALWDDGTGKPELACKDIEISGNIGAFAKPEANCVPVNIGKNCSFHLGFNTWQPGLKREMVQQ